MATNYAATPGPVDSCFEETEAASSKTSSQLDAYTMIGSSGQVIRHCFDSGTVLLVTSKNKTSQSGQGGCLAVRKYHLDNCQKDIDLFIKEIWLMKHLQHANLLTCIDSFVFGHSLCVVTPLMDYGSALDLIQNHFPNGLPEIVIAGLLRDVLQALIYLHSKGYIHRSVRASHILLSSNGQVVLTGLRDAYCIVEKGRWQRSVFDYPSDATRSLCWLSPELLQQNLRGYGEKSDIYSLGITACELANGVPPYVDLPSTQLLINKFNGPPPQLWDCNTVPPPEPRTSTQPTQPSDSGVFEGVTANSNIDARLEAACQRSFSRSFHRFTMLCVQTDPNLRPTAQALAKHPFIQSIRKGSVVNWLEYLQCVPTIGWNAELESSPHRCHEEPSSSVPELNEEEWDFLTDE